MWQAEIRVDLGAIRDNVARLLAGTSAELMAVVKADGYGHGMLPSARAALAGGATWLGVCTIGEATALRASGITAPILAWLWAPGAPLDGAVAADVDISVATLDQLDELITAGRAAGRPARTHLKIDSGLNRNGAKPADWLVLVDAAAKAQAAGDLDVVGVWSHLAYADAPGHQMIDRQLAVFTDGVGVARRAGLNPKVRHLANSAATLTRPDTHFDLVRPGIAIYGLSPVPGRRTEFGLHPAMTCRARVTMAKRVPGGEGVSYGHTYVTPGDTTLALVPMGYADGVPRHASNVGPVRLGGRVRTISGRVCMDQIVLDCGDDDVRAGDVATLFGPGADGEPTADDWAEAIGTINYEIVTRIGSTRVDRVFDEPPGGLTRLAASG
jgi:alanine racemase